MYTRRNFGYSECDIHNSMITHTVPMCYDHTPTAQSSEIQRAHLMKKA